MTEPDLTTEEGARVLMALSDSEEAWNANCDAVKRANGGFPDFWAAVMVHPDVAASRARLEGREVEVTTAKWSLLPPAEDKCQECAVEHDPRWPHDAQSLFYQYHFYFKNGRWPTWGDAMAHCEDEIAEGWKHALLEHGVNPEKLEPSAA